MILIGFLAMSSFRKNLMKQGMKLMSDPRFAKLLQDERVMKAVVQVMSMPGKLQTFTNDRIDQIARTLNLATEEEVKDLRRQVRRLEDDLTRLERINENQKGRS